MFGLLDSNILRNKEIRENDTHPRGVEKYMSANGNTQARTTTTTTTSRSQSATRARRDGATVREGSAAYARQSAERELKSIRTRVERELNRFERRGASARRKTRTRVRQTHNRVERELKQRRRKVQTTVKQNRAKAEDGLKRAQTAVQERVSTLV